MTTKLVSANMGISLIVERDGKEEKVQWSCAFPNSDTEQPIDAVKKLLDLLNGEFGTDLYLGECEYEWTEIAKPKIKAKRRAISHNEFNQKISELGQ